MFWKKGGLSARLLRLTVLFVMIAEVLIYVPSIAHFRVRYLKKQLEAAELAVLALDVTAVGMLDAGLQRRLLERAGSIGIAVHRQGAFKLMLGLRGDEKIDAYINLHRVGQIESVTDAMATLFRREERVLAVTDTSRHDTVLSVETFLPEARLRAG